MPSWNIHTAHVETLFARYAPDDLGISDTNAFLFGNYAPDLYVGFMVRDASVRIDYCITHCANVAVIPIPDSDQFWDRYIYKRRPKTPTGMSLILGAWAHLATDRVYNRRFRAFLQLNDAPEGEELRKRKQGDFARFGKSLSISSLVQVTDELVEAAHAFRPYGIFAEDVARCAEVANDIVRRNAEGPDDGSYRLLNAAWLNDTFASCDERLGAWLETWQTFEAAGRNASAADMREALAL